MARRLTGRFEARPMAAINLTPLIPVLLAVFAVVAIAASSTKSGVQLDQPPMDCFGVCRSPAAFFVSLRSDGAAFVGDRQVRDADVVPLLLHEIHGREDYSLSIRFDAEVPYGRMFAMMRALHEAGLKQPRLLNEDIH